MRHHNNTSRRDFLKLSSTLSLFAATPLISTKAFAETSAKLSNNVIDQNEFDDWLVFDGLGYFFDINDLNNDSIKVSDRMRAALQQSGLNCIRFTLRPVKPIYPGDTPALEQAVNSIASTYKWVSENSDILTIPRTAQDIIEAKAAGKLAVTLCFQNSHMLANDLDRVDTFRDLGVLTMQLTYNDTNRLGGGANVNSNIALSEFGHAAVEKMNESNVLIDLSHSGERTCLDAIEASRSPVTISHSGCRALVDIPRNKSDKELRALADKGGVFGLYFMPFLANDGQAKLAHLIEHIDHALNICGTDHVAFGTDGSYITGIDDLEAVRKFYSGFTQKRINSGVAAEGEVVGNVNFLPDLTGPDMFYKLANAIVAKGHSKSVARKVLGENALRIASEVWDA